MSMTILQYDTYSLSEEPDNQQQREKQMASRSESCILTYQCCSEHPGDISQIWLEFTWCIWFCLRASCYICKTWSVLISSKSRQFNDIWYTSWCFFCSFWLPQQPQNTTDVTTSWFWYLGLCQTRKVHFRVFGQFKSRNRQLRSEAKLCLDPLDSTGLLGGRHPSFSGLAGLAEDCPCSNHPI